jgi:hypothetical protein
VQWWGPAAWSCDEGQAIAAVMEVDKRVRSAAVGRRVDTQVPLASLRFGSAVENR